MLVPKVLASIICIFGEREGLVFTTKRAYPGALKVDRTIKQIKHELPDSFGRTIDNLKPVELRMYTYPGLPRSVGTLVLCLSHPCLDDERAATVDTIDRQLGRWNKWRKPSWPIKLGVSDIHFSRDQLDELQTELPENITAQPGFVRKTTISPLAE